MATLADIRQKHPEYADLSDQQLAEGLHKKFYSDMSFEDFAKKVQFAPQDIASIRQPEAPPVTGVERAGAVAGGFNSGVAALAGIGVDTMANMRDLGKAAIGAPYMALTGKTAPSWLQITDRAQDFGSGAYIRAAMNKLPGQPASIPRPDDKASRYLAAAGAALPAVATMRPANMQQLASTTTQTAVPMLAAQAAAEQFPDSPEAQIGGALLGQLATGKIANWVANRPRPAAIPSRNANSQSSSSARTTATGGGAGAQAGVSGSVDIDINNPGSQFGHVGADPSAGLTRMQREVMRRGTDLGMRLTPGQATGSRSLQQMEAKLESQPMTSGPFNALKENNARIVSRSAAKAVGEADPMMDAATIDKAFTRIGKVFEAAKDDVPRTIDPKDFLSKYKAINDDMRGVVKGFGSHPLVEDFVDLASKGSATGKELQNLTSKLGKAAKNQMTSASGDRELGLGLYRMKDHVDDLLQSGMKGSQAAEFAAARGEYRNLMMLTSRTGVVDPSTGWVSGRNLANVLQMADKKGFTRDKNRTDMYDAARFSKAFGPAVGDSGTATRSPIQGATEMALRIPYNIAARAYTSPMTVEAALQAQAMARATGDAVAPVARQAFGPVAPGTNYLPYMALIEELQQRQKGAPGQ
jgi:hypothetical protein